MVIDRWDTSGYGDIERNQTAVILRHIDSDRIAANLFLGLEQPKIKSVRMMMERPCDTQP